MEIAGAAAVETNSILQRKWIHVSYSKDTRTAMQPGASKKKTHIETRHQSPNQSGEPSGYGESILHTELGSLGVWLPGLVLPITIFI